MKIIFSYTRLSRDLTHRGSTRSCFTSDPEGLFTGGGALQPKGLNLGAQAANGGGECERGGVDPAHWRGVRGSSPGFFF